MTTLPDRGRDEELTRDGNPARSGGPIRGGARGVPCVRCGYDLSTLDRHSDCPECGTPVEATTLGPLLAAIERRSLRAARPSRRPFVRAGCLLRGAAAGALIALLLIVIRACARG